MNLFILTGAGISAESGISTFRGQDGLWEGHAIEEVASPEGFQKDPALVQEFYNLRRAQLNEVEANAAHLALAKLANAPKIKVTLVTQNVDDLHERAGSKDVLHMHGELRKARCVACSKIISHQGDLNDDTRCDSCHGQLRPHICWFGEVPFHMDEISHALNQTALFLAIGTSGLVYPAADFVSIMADAGVPTIEFNLELSEASALFDDSITGKAGETLPRWVNDFLSLTE